MRQNKIGAREPSYSSWAGNGEAVMYVKSRLIFAAIVISSATVLGSVPVQAQDRVTSGCTSFVTAVINVPAFVTE